MHSHELGCTCAILIRNVIRCVPLLGLPTSGLFSLGRSFYNSLSWGPTVSIDFWSKFSPVDFNRDFAACLIFLPCTSPAIFNPVFKATRSSVFAPFFNKGMAALKRYCQVHVLFDIVFPQIPDIIFLLDVCNNRNDELVSF